MATVAMYGIFVNEESQPNVGYLVWRLSMRWRAAVDRAVAPLGLTHAQYSALASLFALSRARQPSQRELADYTGLDAIYISKLVRALRQAGFVARSTHPTDPRAVQLSLTDSGTAVVTQAMGIVRRLQQRLIEPLGTPTSGRTKEFAATLTQLLAHVEHGPDLSAGEQP